MTTRIIFLDGSVEHRDRVSIGDNGWVYCEGYDPSIEPAGMVFCEKAYSPHAIRSVEYGVDPQRLST